MHEVAAILAQADFLLIYSAYETQGLVMLESFASGVPVLTSAVGGIPENMSNDRGIELPPNEPEELIQGIQQMLDQSDQYDANAMRQFVVENFSVECIQAKFMDIYRQSLKSKHE